MWMVPDNDGNVWGWFTPHAAATNTEYVVRLGPLSFIKAIETVFFPLQWTHTCLSLDSSKIKVVADGQLLVEEEYKREEDTRRPANLSMMFGLLLDP